MEKKPIINKSRLDEIVNEKISQVINEEAALRLHQINSSEYNQMRCLNEMAQINKNENGVNKKVNFDANVYRVYVIGEGGYIKFPHFHIEKPSEGWDIRMNIDGSFHSIKRKCGSRQNENDFTDIERIAKEWVKQPNTMNSKFTNGELAKTLWDSMN